MTYYSFVELWLDQFSDGRLSILGIIGSAIAVQGVLSNSVELVVSRILMLLAGCNLGFVFAVGLRIRTHRTPLPVNKFVCTSSGCSMTGAMLCVVQKRIN